MTRRVFSGAVVCAVLGMILVGGATAATVTARFDSASPARGLSYHVSKALTPSPYGWLSGSTQAGKYNFTATASTYEPIGPGDQFSTFCMDLSQYISYNHTYTWEIKDVTEAPVPNTYAGGSYITAAQKDLLQKHYARNLGLIGTSGLNAAAFQIVVWELVFEHWTAPNYDTTNGSMYVTNTNGARDVANTMLNNLESDWGSGEKIPSLVALVNNCSQDQMWLVPGGEQPHIPEPLTVIGMFLGLGSVGAYLRKRRMA